jgi:hypothetical protein
MPHVEVDHATGVLVVDGKKVFPIGFSNPPPLGAKAPNAQPALKELKDAGGNFIRIGIKDWSLAKVDTQLHGVVERLQEAADNELHCWLWLGELPANLVSGKPRRELLLKRIVTAVRDHPGLGAYKGYDEPLWNGVGVDGLARTLSTLKQPDFDPHHPLVLIQAPRMRPPKKKDPKVKVRDGGVPLTVARLKRYVSAYDITGSDVFPISNPPFNHASSATTNISVVGEVTRKMVKGAQGKPVWMTLQIAHSGTPFPHVPCFPSLHEERFMAYDAIVNGARGLMFFGGHMTQVCTPDDAAAGWNWTFWTQVLRPLVAELSSDDLLPALLAPSEQPTVKASPADKKKVAAIELATRRDSKHLYVIAARRGGTASLITMSGLPRNLDGTAIEQGEVLFEHIQWPTPKALKKFADAHEPVPPHAQVLRPVTVKDGAFADRFRPFDVHVYRFAL